MQRYNHYGVEVVRQIIDGSFTDYLKKEGIKYTELPFDDIIVTYEKDGVKKYAVIFPLLIPDDYAEKVYVTERIPDDCDWKALVNDVEAQHDGEEPKKIKTRIRYMLDKAIDYVAKESSCGLWGIPEETPEYFQTIQRHLIASGYSLSELSKLKESAYDVDPEFLGKIVKAGR